MPIISMVGCNAIGKTTAAYRWSKQYGERLTCIIADNRLVLRGESKIKERRWKGTSEEKKALVEKYEAESGVVLIESARTTHLEFVNPQSYTLVVTCTASLYEKHMRARCDKKAKRFRDDYWTTYNLEYECHRRYVNYVAKQGIASQQFVIEDQAKDWPAVDEYFSKVFRRLYDARNK